MADKEGRGLRVVNSVVSAPVNVVRGTFDGAADGASIVSKPFNEIMNDPNAPGIVRVAGGVVGVAAGVAGGIGGAVVGVGVSSVKGVGRILSSVFSE